jgi:beta-lactamase regulating signal transducer with metallopeptidase domain
LDTEAKGTPFTFFHYIVWNRAIDLASENGQRIFQHEKVHVQQRDTWDKVFVLLLFVPFWINPFFWFIRRELSALHEFTADQRALNNNDTSVLAQMILNTAFPQQQFLFTNHLFQSTIKRRIAMFTKLQNPKVS